MRSIVLIGVLCLHLGWSYGNPRNNGAFSYGDSSGNRYGGTYGSSPNQAFNGVVGFFPPFMQSFWSNDDFFPDYFSNLEVLLKEAFESNFENQRRAYTAARKAFDLTSNQAGYIPNLTSRFRDQGGFGGLGAFPGFPMQGQGMNSAFAGAAVGPDFTHQVAAINPKNPRVQNVNVMNRFADTTGGGDKDYYSVSSSSFVSSSNVGGKEKSHRKAETVVNRNGEISHFKVED